jgi:uncharacterized membrane protein
MSTQTITRKAAIARLRQITEFVKVKNYRGIEQVTNECEDDLQPFVDKGIETEIVFEYWTNRMLSDRMDQPFYRYTMNETYYVEDETNDN